jgi:hypothetical protein
LSTIGAFRSKGGDGENLKFVPSLMDFLLSLVLLAPPISAKMQRNEATEDPLRSSLNAQK